MTLARTSRGARGEVAQGRRRLAGRDHGVSKSDVSTVASLRGAARTWAFIALLAAAGVLAADTEAGDPEIDVWYGDQQPFGGVSQRWINVLGTVSAEAGVGRLQYRLNGGAPRTLAVGPDDRRLAAAGDFNIDIERRDLERGSNRVEIELTDAGGRTTARSVEVIYDPQRSSVPLDVDWQRFGDVQEAARVVDGFWMLTPQGLRTSPDSVAYDRTVVVGDVGWSDYEVSVPVTTHSIDPAGYNDISIAPGLAVIVGWQGHTHAPVQCAQPRCGWEPYGANVFYEVHEDGPPELRLTPKAPAIGSGSSALEMVLGKTYVLKLKVQRTIVGPQYSLKAWPAVEAEPEGWQTHLLAGPFPASRGSILLVAHHMDVTFGSLQVLPATLGLGKVPPRLRPLVPALPLVLACLVAFLALGRLREVRPSARLVLRGALAGVAVAALALRFLEFEMHSLLRSRDFEIYQIKRLVFALEVGWYSLLAGLVLATVWALNRSSADAPSSADGSEGTP